MAPGSAPQRSGDRTHPAEVFQAGASLVLWSLAAIAAFAYWQHGWSGPWRLVAILLQPAVILGLVPLAFLFGAIRIALSKALRATLRER